MTRSFRVYFSKVDEEEGDDYLVDHSIVVYLISPTGEFMDFFTQRMQVNDIVARIKKQQQSFVSASSSHSNSSNATALTNKG